MTFFAHIVGHDGKLDPRPCSSLNETKALATLWEKKRQEKGNLRDKSPFLCFECKEVLYWREPIKRSPHFAHAPSSTCPLGNTGTKEQHQRIQSALIRIGKALGEVNAVAEFPTLDDGGRHRFFDVIWPDRRIAWEVDLTLNPKAEQQFRKKLRENRGNLTMISLVCATKLGKRSIPDNTIQTVPVRDLTTSVERPNKQLKLEDAFVYRVARLRRSRIGDELAFYFAKTRFGPFVANIQQFDYGLRVGCNKKRWGWARQTDGRTFNTYHKLQQEIEEHEKLLGDTDREILDIQAQAKKLEALRNRVKRIQVNLENMFSTKKAAFCASLAEIKGLAPVSRRDDLIHQVIIQAEKIARSPKVAILPFGLRRRIHNKSLSKALDRCSDNLYVDLEKVANAELKMMEKKMEKNQVRTVLLDTRQQLMARQQAIVESVVVASTATSKF